MTCPWFPSKASPAAAPSKKSHTHRLYDSRFQARTKQTLGMVTPERQAVEVRVDDSSFRGPQTGCFVFVVSLIPSKKGTLNNRSHTHLSTATFQAGPTCIGNPGRLIGFKICLLFLSFVCVPCVFIGYPGSKRETKGSRPAFILRFELME